MKTSLQKRLTDDFCHKLLESYHKYCEDQQQREEVADLITFLLDRELITPISVRKYTVIRSYEQLRQETNWKKSAVVEHLARRFNLSERSVWNILRQTNK
ncbi:MAG: hypothetical protein AB8G22_29080 [Saprospiraceae bacterium]